MSFLRVCFFLYSLLTLTNLALANPSDTLWVTQRHQELIPVRGDMGLRVWVPRSDQRDVPLSTVRTLPTNAWTSDLTIDKTKDVYWLRLLLANGHQQALDLVLYVAYWSKVEVFVPEADGHVQYQLTGRNVPYDEHTYPDPQAYAVLHLPRKGVQEVYIRVQSDRYFDIYSDKLVVKLGDRQAYEAQKASDDMWNFAMIVALLMMAAYNAVVYYAVRVKVYLYYVLSTLCFAVYQIFQSDIGYEWFWYRYPFFHWSGGVYPAMLSSIFFAQFTRAFMDTRKHAPVLDKFLRFGPWLFVIPFTLLTGYYLLVLTSWRSPALLSNLYILLFLTVVVLITAFYCAYKQLRAGKIFVMATIALATGVIGYVIDWLWQDRGNNVLLQHSMMIGYLIQLVILSIGLADQINELRNNLSAAQVEQERLHRERAEERQRLMAEQNALLEQRVVERTSELQQAVEELNTTNESLNEMYSKVESQRRDLAVSNKKITDSINYARRIQQGILPEDSFLDRYFDEHFIFFRPKDIVSGDFYWYGEVNHRQIILVADCTGHGVPGAFMSLIGAQLLEQIVVDRRTVHPAAILTQMHLGIVKTLRQRADDLMHDGMDIAVTMWDQSRQTLHFAGANNPLLLYRQGELTEIKGDHYPLGGAQHRMDRTFHEHQFFLSPGDQFYLYSDGYADQFGGPDGRKYLSRRFRETIRSVASLPMQEQGALVAQHFHEWIGHETQVDDVTVMGVKI